jgi:4-amino-4-deoxy-L-arabinose transferase-like glycosyltransferase
VLATLPFLSLCFCFLFFRRQHRSRRQSLMLATVPCALFCAYLTEMLSVFRALSQLSLVLAWLGWAAVCAVVLLRYRRAPTLPQNVEVEPSLDGWDRMALLFSGIIVAVVAITGIVCAPNVADSMQYHLPRIVMWVGNHGVYNYPTPDRQQLGMPPMAEYLMMHLYLLYGSDRLVNLVQWMGYLGTILCVSLIIQELGGSRKAQVFGAVLTVTLPTALLGASGPKNDNILTYWIAVTVYFLLIWRRKPNWWTALGIAISGSLAAFTKGTAYVLMPFLLLACWMIWDSKARRRFLVSLPLCALVLVSVCGPLWVRNHKMSGSILGMPYFDGVGAVEHRRYAISAPGLAPGVAGVIRNVGLNVSLPSKKLNVVLTRIFRGTIRAIGVDPDDPRQMTFHQDGTPLPFTVDWTYRNEILSANQWVFILFLVAGILFLQLRQKMRREWGWLAFGLIGSFILYSILLRWAPWNARYHLPLMALAAVFVALVFSQAASQWMVRSLMLLLLIASLPLILMNDMRPWITKRGRPDALLLMPREQVYFFDGHMSFADAYIRAARSTPVKSCRSIGLDVAQQHYEYPLMAIIKDNDSAHTFQYVAVDNQTKSYADAASPPVCVVICTDCAGNAEKMQQYAGNSTVERFGETLVFSNGGASISIADIPAVASR